MELHRLFLLDIGLRALSVFLIFHGSAISLETYIYRGPIENPVLIFNFYALWPVYSHVRDVFSFFYWGDALYSLLMARSTLSMDEYISKIVATTKHLLYIWSNIININHYYNIIMYHIIIILILLLKFLHNEPLNFTKWIFITYKVAIHSTSRRF